MPLSEGWVDVSGVRGPPPCCRRWCAGGGGWTTTEDMSGVGNEGASI